MRKRKTKRQQADKERFSYRGLKDIMTMQDIASRHRDKIVPPSNLAAIKSVLSKSREEACEEGGDPSNVPLPHPGGKGTVGGGGLISEPAPKETGKPWVFITKPHFKRHEKSFREPLVDVFEGATEVQIVIDLGNFKIGEIDIDMKPDKYIIYAKKGDMEFREEIVLPPNVDLEKTEEHYKNGILHITLSKKEE